MIPERGLQGKVKKYIVKVVQVNVTSKVVKNESTGID